jgi:hypothetical protein
MECVCPKMPWASANSIPQQRMPRMALKTRLLLGRQPIPILAKNVVPPFMQCKYLFQPSLKKHRFIKTTGQGFVFKK